MQLNEGPAETAFQKDVVLTYAVDSGGSHVYIIHSVAAQNEL